MRFVYYPTPIHIGCHSNVFYTEVMSDEGAFQHAAVPSLINMCYDTLTSQHTHSTVVYVVTKLILAYPSNA